MKIDINGVIREMTEEELTEFTNQPDPVNYEEPDENTRLDEIEAALMELAEIIGGGE